MRLSISLSEVCDSWRSKLPRCSPDIPPWPPSPAGDPDCSIWNSAVFDVEGSFAENCLWCRVPLWPRNILTSCVKLHRAVPQQLPDHQIVSRIIEFASPETDMQ